MAPLEQYKKRFEERSSEKLFIGRNKQGRINEKFFETARNVENLLNKYKSFVGVTLRGSSVLGYSQKSSDIDLGILYDPSKGDYDFDAAVFKLKDKVQSALHAQRDIHIVRANVSPEALKSDIQSDGEAGALASLCELTADKSQEDKIQQYRATAASLMEDISDSERAYLLERIVGTLLGYEKIRLSEIEWRITDTHGNWDHDRFIQGRKALWTKRVKQIYNL